MFYNLLNVNKDFLSSSLMRLNGNSEIVIKICVSI